MLVTGVQTCALPISFGVSSSPRLQVTKCRCVPLVQDFGCRWIYTSSLILFGLPCRFPHGLVLVDWNVGFGLLASFCSVLESDLN